jgi:hypothetical protein
MTRPPLLALLAALGGCILQPRPVQPPTDPRERAHAEAAACARNTVPAWLDDTAMNAAIEIDRRESRASAANDSFRGATFTAQPPATGRPEPRVAALLEERRAFQVWCSSTRRKGPALDPSGGEPARSP